jgi:membrane associated rhomboid family serine protease
VTSAASNSNNVCYRHPDRQSYILCQRCGRTICPQCQTQAAVGVQCPECIKEGRASTPRTKPRFVTNLLSGRAPIVTYSIMALTVVIWLLQIIPGSPVTDALVLWGPYVYSEPWRMLTSVFVHSTSGPFHILLNMFSLFMFGPILERLIGRVRFLVLYLVSGLGGSVAVLLIAPLTPVLGASGAIFGLVGAFFVIQRKLGGSNTFLLILIGVNLVYGFLPGTNIAWEAHVGGLVAGVAVALVYLRTRRRDQRVLQIVLVSGIVIVLILLTLVRLYVLQ